MIFIHMKSFVYRHIHPCKWIQITLNFKFQAPSSGFTLMHKPSIDIFKFVNGIVDKKTR